MSLIPIILLVSWFLFYIVLKGVNAYFGSAFVFLTFIFAFIVSSQSFSSFYLLIYLIVIVLDLAIGQISTTSHVQGFKRGKFTSAGFKGVGISLLVGFVMLASIRLLSRQVGANIVGVPNLAIATPSTIALGFKPVFESALGIIENQVAFVIFDIMMVFGLLIPLIGILVKASGFIVPLLISSLVMAIFHITAYSVAIALLLYAMIAFAMFIASRMLFKDSLAADVAHYANNGIISVSRSLAVVGI